MSTVTKASRLDFIPELREQLTKHLLTQGLAQSVIDSAFKHWDAGEASQGPWEAGCFAVFNKVQADIRATS
jgi:hypothetical protein